MHREEQWNIFVIQNIFRVNLNNYIFSIFVVWKRILKSKSNKIIGRTALMYFVLLWYEY